MHAGGDQIGAELATEGVLTDRAEEPDRRRCDRTARDAAIAWLLPLPPHTVLKPDPSTVSPGAGSRVVVATRSMFTEPSTVIAPRGRLVFSHLLGSRHTAIMTAFVDSLRAAAEGDAGIVTGEPSAPTRTLWREVHAAARRGAQRLVDGGLRLGESVAVLAAEPAEVAPAVQAVWLAGGSVTMLHQPTPRTDPERYAEETGHILGVIHARRVVLGTQFAAFHGPAGSRRYPHLPGRRPGRRRPRVGGTRCGA